MAARLCFVLGGLLSKMQQEHEEALSYNERTLSMLDASLPDCEDRTYLRALLNKGTDLKALGHLDAAVSTSQRALKATKKACGRGHPETAYVHNNLGSALRDKAFAVGKKRYLSKARSHYLRALKIREKQRPPHPPDVAESLLNLGHLMLDARLFGLARGYLERALRLDGTPPVPPDIRAKVSRLLGLLSRDQGRLYEARAHLSESVRMYEAAYGPDHPFTKEARRLSRLPRPPS